MKVISLTYSFLDAVPSGATYVVMSLLARSIMGVGSSGFRTASLAILAKEFPNNIATVNVCDFTLFHVPIDDFMYRLMILDGI